MHFRGLDIIGEAAASGKLNGGRPGLAFDLFRHKYARFEHVNVEHNPVTVIKWLLIQVTLGNSTQDAPAHHHSVILHRSDTKGL